MFADMWVIEIVMICVAGIGALIGTVWAGYNLVTFRHDSQDEYKLFYAYLTFLCSPFAGAAAAMSIFCFAPPFLVPWALTECHKRFAKPA